jgi:hypothetical protein
LIRLITLITLLFCLAIAFDLSPFLRGPTDIFLESRWPYYFVNTLHKIWAPLAAGTAISIWGFLALRNKLTNKKFLIGLIILTFLWQLSLVYFSRFGLGVLFRRLVTPGINGYFSAAIFDMGFLQYAQKFPELKNTFSQHARSHPPGTVWIIKSIIAVTDKFPRIADLIPEPNDSISLWSPLTPGQKIGSIISIFVLHLIAATSVIIPFYLSPSRETAIKSAILYSVVPAVSFFALTGDPLYAIFAGLSLIALIKNKPFLAGLLMGLGMFFSVVSLVVLAIIVIYILLSEYKTNLIKYLFGIALFAFILQLIGINLIGIYAANISDQAQREYWKWFIYNPYDFFVFTGLPIAIIFIYQLFSRTKNKLMIAFWIVFIILVYTGVSRGEVGRTWLPLMIFPVAISAQSKILAKNNFYWIILLLIIQTIVMEEFWVPTW